MTGRLQFKQGYVKYRFPNRLPANAVLESLQFSLEIGSEAPLHSDDWPSDITRWINGDDRPYFDSESGPIDDWIGDVDFDREYHHNMSWGHLAAGGAGSGMRWPYTNPHWILPELRDNLLGLARFAATIDWAHFSSHNVNGDIRLDRPDIFRVGCSDGRTAIVWLLRDTRQENAPTLPGAVLTLDDVLEDGAYTVEFLETDAGARLESVTAQVTGSALAVTIPDVDPALKGIAIVVRPDVAS